MTPLDMEDALRAWVETLVADLVLEGENAEQRTVHCYGGQAPKRRRGEADPQLNYVIVRAIEGEDGAGSAGARESTVEAALYIGAHRAADDGYRDVHAIINKIRPAVLQEPVFGGRYRIELPLSWSVSDEDTYPQWYGAMVFRVVIPQPVELASLGEVDDL